MALLKEIGGGDIGEAVFAGQWDGHEPVELLVGVEHDCGGWACHWYGPNEVPKNHKLVEIRPDEWILKRI